MSWGKHCTSARPRLESHRDEQRESYEDAVDAVARAAKPVCSQEETETRDEFFARLARGGRFHRHGADRGLGRPDARDACDEDEGSW